MSNETLKLFGDYTCGFVNSEEFDLFFGANRNKVFADNYDFDIRKVLSEKEKQAMQVLSAKTQTLEGYYLLIFCKNEPIGWSFGIQKSFEDIYMVNTGILPQYQNQGIYKAVLPIIVTHLKQMGFQRIYSRHKASNNRVIVPKLKAGFVISGMEVDDHFGVLVFLSYYTNEKRRHLLNVRIGMEKPE